MTRGSCYIGPTADQTGLRRYIGTTANDSAALVGWNQPDPLALSDMRLRTESPADNGMRAMWIDSDRIGGSFGIQEGPLAVPAESRPLLSSGIASVWVRSVNTATGISFINIMKLLDDTDRIVRVNYTPSSQSYELFVQTSAGFNSRQTVSPAVNIRTNEWVLLVLEWEIVESRIRIGFWVSPESPDSEPLLSFDSDDTAETYTGGPPERWGAYGRGNNRSFFYAPLVVHGISDREKAFSGRICYAGSLPAGVSGIDVEGAWETQAASSDPEAIRDVLADENIATTYAESETAGDKLTLRPGAPPETPPQVDVCEAWLVVSGPGEVKVRGGVGGATGSPITYSVGSRRQEIFHPIAGVGPSQVDEVEVEVEVVSTTDQIRVYAFRAVTTGGEVVGNGGPDGVRRVLGIPSASVRRFMGVPWTDIRRLSPPGGTS